jgi:outer membrane murein-binding lipoprotein Lpp
MKKSLAFSIVVCVLWLYGIVDANGLKTTELNRKMSEISSLQQSLTGKIAQADQKRDQLEQKALELRNEIKAEMEQFKIESYQMAIQNPRIDYNLKLIQLLLGYIDRLNEKIEYFKNGNETLTFFFQQAEDDRMMIKALNDLETDKLISQINEVLDEYIPETGKPMFDVNDVPLKDTEKIWHEIIKTN